jgi:hypothetical protein
MNNHKNKSSPSKRDAGQASQNRNLAKKGSASVERKDWQRLGKTDAKLKTASAVQASSNVYLQSRPNELSNSSMGKSNPAIPRDIFHSKERKSILDQFYQESRVGPGIDEPKASTAKYKKLPHALTGGYKPTNPAAQNRISNLDQSAPSLEKSRQGQSKERASHDARMRALEERKRLSNNSLGTSNHLQQSSLKISGPNRVGIHQGQSDMIDIDLKGESR